MRRFPRVDKTSFLLFSMMEKSGIEELLRKFPALQKLPSTDVEREYVSNAGVSATVLWSGSGISKDDPEGYNVRIEPFQNKVIGYVMNPFHVLVEQGDFEAANSSARLSKSVLQRRAEKKDLYNGTVTKVDPDQTADPSVVTQTKEYCGDRYVTINIARTTLNVGGYPKSFPTGCIDRFAKNVFRQEAQENFFPKHYNEAVVFQKGDVNPISGIFINLIRTPLTDFTESHLTDIKALLEATGRNSTLFLYFPFVDEHIVRCITQSEALSFIDELQTEVGKNNTIDIRQRFIDKFRSSKPYHFTDYFDAPRFEKLGPVNYYPLTNVAGDRKYYVDDVFPIYEEYDASNPIPVLYAVNIMWMEEGIYHQERLYVYRDKIELLANISGENHRVFFSIPSCKITMVSSNKTVDAQGVQFSEVAMKTMEQLSKIFQHFFKPNETNKPVGSDHRLFSQNVGYHSDFKNLVENTSRSVSDKLVPR